MLKLIRENPQEALRKCGKKLISLPLGNDKIRVGTYRP
jgi:hypothetical protein